MPVRFSLEMSQEQLFMRMLTSEARIDAHRFRTGYLNEKDYGRLSHALGTLAEARVAFEVPRGAEREERLASVLEVVYLVFNEGYAATAGDDWTRPDLTNEAIRLSRMLSDLAPDEPEVHGLQALLELQGSRIPARIDRDGAPVLLDDQDRSRWDELLIRRGLGALAHAQTLAARGAPVGRYFLQASIAAEHARAQTPGDTRWPRIAQLYDVLARAAPGPVVEVNRAVAHGRAHGPEAGLAILDAVAPDALADTALLPSVRGDLLERLGQLGDAAASFDRAAGLTRNAGERALLERRAALCRGN